VRIALAAAGLTSTIAQVLLMRELVATFYGNELLFGLVLAAWLAWVAAGSWGMARISPPSSPPLSLPPALPLGGRKGGQGQRIFAGGMALAAALLPAQIALVRGARELLGVTPGAFVELGPMVAAVVLVLAPLCLVGGGLFTLGTRLTVERGGAAGRAYVWESAGAVAGGALFSFVLIRWLDPFQTALLVTTLDLAIALWLLKPETRNLKLLATASLLLALSALLAGPLLHAATLRWQWSDLAFAADSAYGRLTVQARDGQRAFFENGLLTFETQGTFPEEVAHFPLLAHPNPREVLLVGGGVAGDVREILKHPGVHVTYVELDPLLIEAAGVHLPAEDASVLNDPRVTVALTDGRLYVRRCVEGLAGASGSTHKTPPGRGLGAVVQRCVEGLAGAGGSARKTPPGRGLGAMGKQGLGAASEHPSTGSGCPRFDVVIVDLPEPSTGALNRFYTVEFFAEVRAVLASGGVFALGLPSAENYWSPELARRNGSVYHTLRAVFPEVAVLPGEHNFFLASEAALETDPAVLASRLTRRGVETRWVTPEYVEYVFTTDRFAEVQAELAATAGVRLNRDLAPICYYYDLALWLSRFYPSTSSTQLSRSGQAPHLRGAFERAGLASLWWVAVPLALVVLLARWRRRLRPERLNCVELIEGAHPSTSSGWAVPLAIAGIGLAEMTLEVVILFAFQMLHGTVYARVSLIVTAFMAGLALGGAAGTRILARLTDGGRRTVDEAYPSSILRPPSVKRNARHGLIAIQLAIAVYSALLPLILSLPVGVPVLAFPLLALIAGGLTGMAFPVAVALMWGRADRAAGLLYGADLVGGCLGALVGAVLFVPVLGIPQTCAAVALVGLAGVLVLI